MMIDPVTGWFEIAKYEEKGRYQSRTQLKLCGFLGTLDKNKSYMTKERNLLIMISENP